MTTTTPTQRRLTALLVGAIYAIANSLFPVIDTVMQQTTRPWLQRANYANRFSRILQQLLALTARIRPESLSRTPAFPPLPDQPAKAAATPKPPGPIRPLGPIRPARLLSARQFAQRLEALLRQLERLLAEVRAALPPIIHRNITRARTIAGCQALPPTQHKTWESAG